MSLFLANALLSLLKFQLWCSLGVDYESKPILVFYACYLPDPSDSNYDELLSEILIRLEEFVESDYVVVLFSAPAAHKPSWSWLIKAYRSLGRK